MSDHDELVMQFCELTGASASKVCGISDPDGACESTSVLTLYSLQATEYLTANDWALSAAVGSFFADDDDLDAPEPAAGSSSQAAAPQEYTGPRTLDGRPAPQSAAQPSSSSKKPAKKKGLATLSSLGGGSGHDHDDDEDDDEDDNMSDRRGPRDLFAGGEKSGLAVQDPARNNSDPQNVIKDILAKAKAYV